MQLTMTWTLYTDAQNMTILSYSHMPTRWRKQLAVASYTFIVFAP